MNGAGRIRGAARTIKPNAETRQLGRDALTLTLYKGAAVIGYLVQLALLTHRLSLSDFGRVTVVLAFTTAMGQLLSLKAAKAAVVRVAARLQRAPGEAVGELRFCYLIDFATGCLGFALCLGIAPVVGPPLIGHDGGTLIQLYAVQLVLSSLTDTSMSSLQILRRQSYIAFHGVVTQALRLALLGAVVFETRNLRMVLAALLVGEFAAGLSAVGLANLAFRRAFPGLGFLRPGLPSSAAARRQVLRLTMHTNVIGYSLMTTTQLPPLIVAAVLTPADAGVLKIGMSAAAGIGMLADPAFMAILPRMTRLWAVNRVGDLRRLLTSVTALSIPFLACAAGLAVVLRYPLLRLLGGHGGAAATTVFVILVVGQAFNAALFWDNELLWACGRAAAASGTLMVGAVVLIPALFIASAHWGVTGAAVSLSSAIICINVALVAFGMRYLAEALRVNGDAGSAKLSAA